MRYKVHIVEERYPDLVKYYDIREYKMGQFTITKPTTTVWFVVIESASRPQSGFW
jgi:hypothetical protein